MPTKPLQIYFTEDERKMLGKMAVEETRSESEQVRWLVREYFLGHLVYHSRGKLEQVLMSLVLDGTLGKDATRKMLEDMKAGKYAEDPKPPSEKGPLPMESHRIGRRDILGGGPAPQRGQKPPKDQAQGA